MIRAYHYDIQYSHNRLLSHHAEFCEAGGECGTEDKAGRPVESITDH